MYQGRIRAALMAGAATLSLTFAVSANEYSNFIVFGDRTLDAGQYVDPDAVFADDVLGDGRRRFTNRLEDGNYGYPYSDIVSRHLGFGATSPSQATTLGGIVTPPPGLNYAASFNESEDVLRSINGGTYSINGIRYRRGNEVRVIPGTQRPGLLVDPERAGWAANSVVLINGGARDIRKTADIDRDLTGGIELEDSYIELNAAQVSATGVDAANNIADGVDALTGAGARLVIATNVMDMGRIPETSGDATILGEADAALIARQDEADTADAIAVAAETQLQTAQTIEDAARAQLQVRQNLLAEALADPASTQALINNLTAQVDASTQQVASTAANTARFAETANARRQEAVEAALTPHEVALRGQVNAALANPTLIATNRTNATDAFNAQLESRLRNTPNVLLIDQHALMEAVIADPGRFGLNSGLDQSQSCDQSSVLYPCGEADADIPISEQLFATGIDLTTVGAELAAGQITGIVDAPVNIAAAPFVSIGSGRKIANIVEAQVSPERIRRLGWTPFVAGAASKSTFQEIGNEGEQDVQALSGVVGMTFTATKGIAVGIAGAYQDIDDPSGDLAVGYRGTGLFGSVYAGANFGRLFANASATVGKVDYDGIDRHTFIGPAIITNTGKSEADVYGGSVEAGLRVFTYGNTMSLGPIASVDHWSADMDGYAEGGWTATSVQYGDIDGSSTRGSVGLFLEAGSFDDNTMLPVVFRGKALYTREFETDGVQVTAATTENPGGTFTRRGRSGSEDALTFGMQVSYNLGSNVIGSIGYDGRIGDVSDHQGRIDIAVPFNP